MKSTHTPVIVLAVAASTTLLSGCRAIGDIFKAGVGVGIFIVVGLLVVIGGIFAMVTKK